MTAAEIADERYVSLATFRRDGREVRTPVWIAEDGGVLYVFSEAHAGKVKRIRATGRVRLAGCNVRGRVHGAWVEGRGRIVADAAETRRGYAALHRAYGWQMRLGDLLSTLTGRIGNRALLAISLGDAPTGS